MRYKSLLHLAIYIVLHEKQIDILANIQKPGAVNIIPCIIMHYYFIVYNDTVLQCYTQTYLI